MNETVPRYYAQFQEDVNLRKFFPDKNDGFYIDIGVWEHQVDSVTLHFYESGWRGINIEPVPDLFEKFIPYRDRDINLQIAISDQPETKKFFYLPNTGLSTFVKRTRKSSLVSTDFKKSTSPLFRSSACVRCMFHLV